MSERDERVEAVARFLAGEDGDTADFDTNAGQARDYHMERARAALAAADALQGYAKHAGEPPAAQHRHNQPAADRHMVDLVEAVRNVARHRHVTDESFDHVIVPAEDHLRLIEALRKFGGPAPNKDQP